MKFLLVVCGLILALGGIMLSCGPQDKYCPGGNNGACGLDNSLGGSNGSGGDQGDATIISGTGGM